MVISFPNLYPTRKAAHGKGRTWESQGVISQTMHFVAAARLALVRLLPLSGYCSSFMNEGEGKHCRKITDFQAVKI